MTFGRAKWRSDPELLDRQRRQQQLRVPTDQWNAMMEEVGMARDKDAREFNPFEADEQSSREFIASAALTPEQTQIPSLLNLLRGVAASLRKRGCTTAELCQELIKADVAEGLK